MYVRVFSLSFASTLCMYHYCFLSLISSLSFFIFPLCMLFLPIVLPKGRLYCMCVFVSVFILSAYVAVCIYIFIYRTVFSPLGCESISVLRYAGSHSHQSNSRTFHSFQHYLEAVKKRRITLYTSSSTGGCQLCTKHRGSIDTCF